MERHIGNTDRVVISSIMLRHVVANACSCHSFIADLPPNISAVGVKQTTPSAQALVSASAALGHHQIRGFIDKHFSQNTIRLHMYIFQ